MDTCCCSVGRLLLAVDMKERNGEGPWTPEDTEEDWSKRKETVWEAYKIFWDCLPEREEYNDWVNRCVNGSVSIKEIGRYFSQSQEHIHLIKTQESTGARQDTIGVDMVTSELPVEKVTLVSDDNEEEDEEGEDQTTEVSPEADIGNEIGASLLRPPRPLKEQVVELYIRLRGETFTNALRDPSSSQHLLLSTQFTRRIQDAFDKLPGFKNVYVVEFRLNIIILLQGLVVLVHYAITLEVDSTGISNHTLDFITLHNNMVEKNYPGAAEQPTVVYTITDFRNYITEALHKDRFLTDASLHPESSPSQPENVENVLPPGNPTAGTVEALGNVGNVLAAEKPPDAPPQEVDGTDGLLTKDHFLLDTFDPWKGQHSDVASSENDVYLLDESTAPPLIPDRTDDLGVGSYTSSNAGSVEDEGFLFSNLPAQAALGGDHATGPPPPKPRPSAWAEEVQEEGSSGGSSGDSMGSVEAWMPTLNSGGTAFYEMLPPPDLEESTEEEDEGGEEEEVAVRFSEGEEQGGEPTGTPLLRTTAAPTLEEPEPTSAVKSLVVITQDLRTDPRYTSHPPVLWSTDTRPGELSVQTQEALGVYDDFSLTEHFSSTVAAIRPPDPSTPTGTVDQGPLPQKIKVDGSENLFEVLSEPREIEVENGEVVIEHTASEGPTPDSTLSDDQPTPPISTTTTESVLVMEPVPEVLSTEAAEPQVAVANQQEAVEVLEEHVGVTQPVTPTRPAADLSPDDLAEDEVMVVTMTATIAAPVVMVISEQNISLSPEKESPFTRVSDTVPEDDENIQESFHLDNQLEDHIPTSPHHDDHIPESPHHDDHIPESPHHEDHIPESPHHEDHIPESAHHDDHIPTSPHHDNHIPTSAHHDDHIPESPHHDDHHDDHIPTSSHHDDRIPMSPYHDDHHDDDLIPASRVLGTTRSVWAENNQTEGVSPGVHGVPPASEIQLSGPASPVLPEIDLTFDLFQFQDTAGAGGDSSGFSGEVPGAERQAVAMPTAPGRALTVFFSLRVTNMRFSMNLFNKSSAEYQALEQRFLQLLVPYLQSNLSSFQNLEILNFQNGSVVVNSRMRFGRPVPQRVASVVYLILEDWAESAHRTMDLAIDKHSLDVESGDKADPCKFQACNEFSRCAVNDWSGEAECVCSAGYVSVGGLPCRSVCLLHLDFCLNDGKCDIIPGTGAICRCRVGENWWYRGQHCEEYVSEPLVVAIAMVSVVGFLLVGSGVLFFLVRTLRDQYQSDDSEDPLRHGVSASSLEGSSEFSLYQSDTISAQFYRRYDDHLPQYCGGGDTRRGSSLVPQDPPDQDSDQSHHNTSNTRLTTQERLRMLELYAKDEHFADFVRQTQLFLGSRRSSNT
ncbi:unnamed protein product [Merluccius merluccius]